MRDDRFDAFSALLLKLYRTSAESPVDTYQDAALEIIKPLLPFETCMWGTATYRPGEGIDIHTIHLHNQSQAMLDEYAPLKHMDTCAAAVVNQPHVTRGFHSATCFADRSVREYRDYLRRFGHENVFITAATDQRTGATQWFSLFREDTDQHCRAEEVSLLTQLSPHLMQGLRHNRARHLEKSFFLPGDAALEAVIVDARGVIHYATPHSEEMLQAEFGRSGSPGNLPSPLMEWMRARPEPFVGRGLVAAHRVRKDLMYVRLRPRCLADTLAPRQREAAELVAQGLTHKQAAQRLGRSPATVRNQMQEVYRKLQVQNVAELANALRQAQS